ncbi:MAG: nucleotidyltransferase domain-containing protein [Nitrospirota bacterium]
MKNEDFRIARELKSRLSSLVELLDFTVFGSRARGDADEYSDMDVFFEVESLDSALKEKISEIVWEVEFNNYTVISPLILTREKLENSPLRSSPIVEVIAEEGVAV